MNLRRLNHVVALADTLHFARAAEAAHLSQPAFSRSIQAIEADLGIRLFDRDIGDVRATSAGEFVIERARKLLFEARCLQRDVDLYRDGELWLVVQGWLSPPSSTGIVRLRGRTSSPAANVAIAAIVRAAGEINV